MTHDELIELTKSSTYMNSRTLEHPYIALRAVLELHKPYFMQTEDEEILGCSCIPELPAFLNPYPCPTIQAIEKEMK